MIKIKVKVGDEVLFERNGKQHFGAVFKVQERSVLIDITDESRDYLDYSTAKTVVSHSNYTIVKPTQAASF